MLTALDIGANPSSVHGEGRDARRVVETARTSLANAIGGRAEDIVFTSGGTEANALAIQGALKLIPDAVVLWSDLEHSAVKGAIEASGAQQRKIKLTSEGILDLDDLGNALEDLGGKTPFLCLMHANNETGIVQPVAEAARLVREKDGLVHCDAAQTLGKLKINVGLLGVDYMAFSAHKFGGPQGVGALWFRAGAPLKPIMLGGGQERSLRSGTENVSGIGGFGAAIDVTAELTGVERVQEIRDRFEALVEASAPVTIFGKTSERLPGTSNLALEGFKSETQVMAMDLAGVAVSAGSACSSGKVRQSDVLIAMGVPDELAGSAIRVSFGWASTLADSEKAAESWLAAAKRAVPSAFKEST